MVSDQLDDERIAGLLAAAGAACATAYAPYSRLQVGAALLTADGRVYAGANVENSSYGLTVCAERVAVFKAVTEGARDFVAIAVVIAGWPGASPCGACRQVLYEFAPEMTVVLATSAGPASRRLSDLLPLGFRIEH
jgi:cytidine deaminase